MARKTVTLTKAKAHLSQLTDIAAQGQTVIITKHGKPVMQVCRIVAKRKPIALQELRALTDPMPLCKAGSGKLLRKMRDEQRY